MSKKNVTVTITLPREVFDKVEKESKKNIRSRSSQIAIILAEYFKEDNHAIKQ